MPMSKKSFLITFFAVLGFFTLFSSPVFCQSSYASAANKRTAIRYMKLAKQKLAEKEWSDAEFNANLGLAYDDSIADLWYISAAAKMSNGDKKSEILPVVSKAFGDTQWVDYNKDGARILYADILCSTRQYGAAISVLDENPFIYSSDAEYIRAKAYYSLGTEENVGAARRKIDAARRVYPKDSRFAELFYCFEFALASEKILNSDVSAEKNAYLSLENFALDENVQKIADAFLS